MGKSSNRQSISKMKLESAITAAVKKSGPDCEHFVGVIIERETPKSKYETNWDVRGARFGKSDRKKASEALESIVEWMRREFSLMK